MQRRAPQQTYAWCFSPSYFFAGSAPLQWRSSHDHDAPLEWRAPSNELVEQCGFDHRPELHAQVARVGVVRLDHVDGEQLVLGIDPEGRAGGARPAVLADRARLRRVTDGGTHLEAQAEAEARRTARPVADMVGGHEGERLLADDALAVQH